MQRQTESKSQKTQILALDAKSFTPTPPIFLNGDLIACFAPENKGLLVYDMKKAVESGQMKEPFFLHHDEIKTVYASPCAHDKKHFCTVGQEHGHYVYRRWDKNTLATSEPSNASTIRMFNLENMQTQPQLCLLPNERQIHFMWNSSEKRIDIVQLDNPLPERVEISAKWTLYHLPPLGSQVTFIFPRYFLISGKTKPVLLKTRISDLKLLADSELRVTIDHAWAWPNTNLFAIGKKTQKNTLEISICTIDEKIGFKILDTLSEKACETPMPTLMSNGEFVFREATAQGNGYVKSYFPFSLEPSRIVLEKKARKPFSLRFTVLVFNCDGMIMLTPFTNTKNLAKNFELPDLILMAQREKNSLQTLKSFAKSSSDKKTAKNVLSLVDYMVEHPEKNRSTCVDNLLVECQPLKTLMEQHNSAFNRVFKLTTSENQLAACLQHIRKLPTLSGAADEYKKIVNLPELSHPLSVQGNIVAEYNEKYTFLYDCTNLFSSNEIHYIDTLSVWLKNLEIFPLADDEERTTRFITASVEESKESKDEKFLFEFWADDNKGSLEKYKAISITAPAQLELYLPVFNNIIQRDNQLIIFIDLPATNTKYCILADLYTKNVTAWFKCRMFYSPGITRNFFLNYSGTRMEHIVAMPISSQTNESFLLSSKFNVSAFWTWPDKDLVITAARSTTTTECELNLFLLNQNSDGDAYWKRLGTLSTCALINNPKPEIRNNEFIFYCAEDRNQPTLKSFNAVTGVTSVVTTAAIDRVFCISSGIVTRSEQDSSLSLHPFPETKQAAQWLSFHTPLPVRTTNLVVSYVGTFFNSSNNLVRHVLKNEEQVMTILKQFVATHSKNGSDSKGDVKATPKEKLAASIGQLIQFLETDVEKSRWSSVAKAANNCEELQQILKTPTNHLQKSYKGEELALAQAIHALNVDEPKNQLEFKQ